MALGKNIRTHRLRQRLTLEALSELSDVDVGTISALEQRDSERSKFASQIARALRVQLEDLLADDCAQPVSHSARGSANVTALKGPPNQAADPLATWPLPGITPEAYFGVLTPQDHREISAFARGLLAARARAENS